IIKLDRTLTGGIDHDPVRRALSSALVSFVDELGGTLVAEGVETDGELATLRRLGIPYAQGYHLGRPGPLPPGLLGMPTSPPPGDGRRQARTVTATEVGEIDLRDPGAGGR